MRSALVDAPDRRRIVPAETPTGGVLPPFVSTSDTAPHPSADAAMPTSEPSLQSAAHHASSTVLPPTVSLSPVKKNTAERRGGTDGGMMTTTTTAVGPSGPQRQHHQQPTVSSEALPYRRGGGSGGETIPRHWIPRHKRQTSNQDPPQTHGAAATNNDPIAPTAAGGSQEVTSFEKPLPESSSSLGGGVPEFLPNPNLVRYSLQTLLHYYNIVRAQQQQEQGTATPLFWLSTVTEKKEAATGDATQQQASGWSSVRRPLGDGALEGAAESFGKSTTTTRDGHLDPGKAQQGRGSGPPPFVHDQAPPPVTPGFGRPGAPAAAAGRGRGSHRLDLGRDDWTRQEGGNGSGVGGETTTTTKPRESAVPLWRRKDTSASTTTTSGLAGISPAVQMTTTTTTTVPAPGSALAPAGGEPPSAAPGASDAPASTRPGASASSNFLMQRSSSGGGHATSYGSAAGPLGLSYSSAMIRPPNFGKLERVPDRRRGRPNEDPRFNGKTYASPGTRDATHSVPASSSGQQRGAAFGARHGDWVEDDWSGVREKPRDPSPDKEATRERCREETGGGGNDVVVSEQRGSLREGVFADEAPSSQHTQGLQGSMNHEEGKASETTQRNFPKPEDMFALLLQKIREQAEDRSLHTMTAAELLEKLQTAVGQQCSGSPGSVPTETPLTTTTTASPSTHAAATNLLVEALVSQVLTAREKAVCPPEKSWGVEAPASTSSSSASAVPLFDSTVPFPMGSRHANFGGAGGAGTERSFVDPGLDQLSARLEAARVQAVTDLNAILNRMSHSEVLPPAVPEPAFGAGFSSHPYLSKAASPERLALAAERLFRESCRPPQQPLTLLNDGLLPPLGPSTEPSAQTRRRLIDANAANLLPQATVSSTTGLQPVAASVSADSCLNGGLGRLGGVLGQADGQHSAAVVHHCSLGPGESRGLSARPLRGFAPPEQPVRVETTQSHGTNNRWGDPIALDPIESSLERGGGGGGGSTLSSLHSATLDDPGTNGLRLGNVSAGTGGIPFTTQLPRDPHTSTQFKPPALGIPRLPSLEESVWEYKDLVGQIQGVFTSMQMRAWWEGNFFSGDLPMRYSPHLPFVPLRELYPPHLHGLFPPFLRFPLVSSTGHVTHLPETTHSPIPSSSPLWASRNDAHLFPGKSLDTGSGGLTHVVPPTTTHVVEQHQQAAPSEPMSRAAMMTHGLRAMLGLCDRQEATGPQAPVTAGAPSSSSSLSTVHLNGPETRQTTESLLGPTAGEPRSDTVVHEKRGRSAVAVPAAVGKSQSKPMPEQLRSSAGVHGDTAVEETRASTQTAEDKQQRHAHTTGVVGYAVPPVKRPPVQEDPEKRAGSSGPGDKNGQKKPKIPWKLPATTARSFDDMEFLEPSASTTSKPTSSGGTGSGTGGRSANHKLFKQGADMVAGKTAKKTLQDFFKAEAKESQQVKSVWNKPPPPAVDQQGDFGFVLGAEDTIKQHAGLSSDVPEEHLGEVQQNSERTNSVPSGGAPFVTPALDPPSSWVTVSKKKSSQLTTTSAAATQPSAPPTSSVSMPEAPQSGKASRKQANATSGAQKTGSTTSAAAAAAPTAPPPFTAKELGEIKKLMSSCDINLDDSMLEYLREFKTTASLVDFLKDSFAESTHLEFFATEFIAILQNPFTTVSYTKSGGSGGGPAAAGGGWAKPNSSWTKSNAKAETTSSRGEEQQQQPSKPSSRRSKKSTKGKAVDPSLLGFSVKSNRIMQGAIDYGD